MISTNPSRSQRVLIVGAGIAGRSLAEDVERAGDTVVGFLDDVAVGPDVLGSIPLLETVVWENDVDAVYFAIPSASGDLLREMAAATARARVELAIIPRTYRVVSRERVSVSDLTDVDVLDFVGRAPVKHDMDRARELVRGKRVLVTGAGGSIGSRIVAQLHVLDPELVVCVDRSEPAIFHLGQALGEAPGRWLEVADVQSEARMGQLMDRYQPDFVFHVAAYKHVPLMQSNPVEAFNNNVWGTLNVMRQAARTNVERAVYVSTDKAVNPTNVMGATKRLGELIVADLGAAGASTRFSGVRFGNVLESEGSVMQTFRRQILAHRNLTVTHPDITRYFMTIDEAAQLVIQTATTGRQGELFVLDMGDPIRIHDLARSLIAAVDPTLEIEIVGLRPGEKMYEELAYETGTVDATTHPKIFVVKERRSRPQGETLAWVERMLERTRDYSISDAELRQELVEFGFTELQ